MKQSFAMFLALLGPALISATPLFEKRTSAVCLAVDAVVEILHAYPSASPFCSSFLHISTTTTTTTVPATASFTSFATTTVPTTVSTFTSTASPVTVYDVSSTTITTCIPSAVNKRAVANTRTTSCSSSTAKSSSTASGIKSSSTISTIKSSTTAKSDSSSLCTDCPAVLQLVASSAVSTACSCLSIATPTITVTATTTTSTTSYPTTTIFSSIVATTTITGTTTIPTTSTSTVNYCPTPSSCSNEGIRWGYYENNVYHADTGYTEYDPTVIKTETPEYQSTASVCGGLYDEDVGTISIYGSSETFQSDYFTLNHVGYLYAEVSGSYTFTFSNVDDIALLWFGSTAYSGWTRDNADMIATDDENDAGATMTYTLTEEEYLPFRIVFGQAQGPVDFYFTVAAPDGTIILDSDTEDSPYLVQYSCDGTTAPAFPAFGSET